MKKLFLLDAYALIYRSYYALINNPRINSKGQNTSAIMGFCNTLYEIISKERPTHIGVAFDHGKTFRHEAFPEYKAQRQETPEDIKFSVPIIKDILSAMNIPIFQVDGFEADDVIGTLALKSGENDIETYMLTPDKDYGQLVRNNVYQFRPRHGGGYEKLGPAEVCDKYGIQDARQVIDLLALMGDSSDNFPGCPGVGEKTAVKLISQFGSIEEMLTHTEEIKGKLREKVEAAVDDIKMSKFLATIRTDVPVELDLEKMEVMKKLGCRLCSVKARRFCTNLMFKLVITGVFLITMFALGWGMQTHESIFLGTFFYISVMANAGWGFYLLAPVVRIRLFNALLFMGLFVWGCMLYFCSPVREGNYEQSITERQIEAPNRTVSAFFPSRGGFEAIAKSNDKQLRLHYFIFHTVVLFYVALLTFAIFGRGFVNRVHKWLTPWRRLNVFWGRSDAGLLLARNITETTVRGQVFFMLQQRSGDGDEWRTLTHDIDRMDAMWSFTYDSNAVETDVSKDTLAQAKGRRHFFMDESGHVNVSRADRLVKVLRKWKEMRETHGKARCFFAAVRAGLLKWWMSGCAEKPYFYVRVEASADELTYQTWAANVRDVVTPVLIRESRLIAKDFIGKYPLLTTMPGIKVDNEKCLVSEGKFNILLVGFGSAGQDVLNEIVCNGQFVQSYDSNGLPVQVPLHVDVVEQDGKVIEEYCIRHPLATQYLVPKVQGRDECFDVNFVNVRVEDKTFDDWFKDCLCKNDKKNPYNRIVVCLNGDNKNSCRIHESLE